ncbi:hypothetical protein ACLB2K_004599 [Fragaria x ananassa]
MKQAPVAWKEICKPKAQGGLGVRPADFFNKAAIAKLAWKVITDKSNWWVQVMQKKYLMKCSFFQAKKKQRNSMAWNGILDTMDLIIKGMRWIVGDDELVSDYLNENGWNTAKLRSVLDENIVKEILRVWKTRNETIFPGKQPNPRSTFAAAMNHLQNTVNLCTFGSTESNNENDQMIRWSLPPNESVKLNFNGSMKSNSAVGGFIFRNPLGSPFAAAAFNFGSTTVPVAEAVALHNGLIDAKRRGFKKGGG